MTIFRNKLLPLLLALLMVVTMLPMTALAAEVPDETTTVCTDEHCTHDHEESETPDVYDVQPDTGTAEFSDDVPETITPEETTEPETPETPVTEPPVEANAYSGHIGDSAVEWELDPASGRLFITGEGGCDTFTSRDDQPWAAVRTEIKEVWFNSMDTLTIENLAYWFDGCTSLETAEVPYTTPVIGTRAFADCPSLYRLMLYYSTADFEITPSAFLSNTLMTMEIDYIAMIDEPATVLYDYDWSADNRAVFYGDVYGMMTLATGYCSKCEGTYSYTVGYDQWTDTIHCIRHWCSNCGYDQCGGVNAGNHSYNSSGYCTYCGYYNSAYDQTSVCYHTSTYKSWSGCDWYEYCRNCGVLVDSGTSHGSTYTTWSGCNWYEYCRDCGQLMDSGVSHSYSYGSWTYYNSSRHSRTGTCTSCGATTTSYGYHSTSTQYSPYSSTQHSYGSYCSICGSYVGSVSYASHSFSYGSWQNYSGSQHRRLKTCSTCGYSEYEYSSHSLSYGSWTNYTASQHRRSVRCSTCGYSSYEYASHSLTGGAWSSISATQHRRTLSCSCGYSTTETASHSLTYGSWQNYNGTQHRRTVSCSTCGYSTYEYADHSLTYSAWASISDTQHQRTGSCSCGYSAKETGAHTDANDDGYCDDCEYLMTRFSVTVPASLSLTVSEHGAVYSANNAAIVNNSTGAVEVTGVAISTANGWTLAPYSSNMANAKVDSKLIGFSLNGAQSAVSGTSENLSLPGSWAIAKGASLPLSYDAVVSALSQPVSEQVLTVVFLLEWAVS